MGNKTLNSTDLKKLTEWDTPTICNGLEHLSAEYRVKSFTVEHMQCFDPSLSPIVGYARTAMIRSMTPPEGSPADVRDMRARYYETIADDPAPSISIIQDIDPTPGFGAFWGEVNTAIHQGLGCLGVITNGSFRDIDACAPGFQLLGGKIAPSHAWVHLVAIECEVNIFGMAVKPNDIIHADRHGAVVVPEDCVKELPAAIDLLTRREAVILDVARAPGFNVDVLKKAMADSAEIH
ncbi:MAG: acyl transferase [Rhodospirillaceae bacterium]|nr:acyl transferase [Rhodospirillaceae bacterium]|tara:strand:- start:179 stop:886 length:708 start_codon:yes stop_codon:yes gene_type:complete